MQCFTFDPNITPVKSIKAKHPRNKRILREKKNVTRLLREQNVIIYAIRKANLSAAYNQTVTSTVLYIVKEGKIPDGSKYKECIDQKRVPGENRTGVPGIPEVVPERVSLDPLFDLVRIYHCRRDGCTVHYQGKSAFRGWQPIQSCFECKSGDFRNCENHGKQRADGAAHVLRSSVK